MTKAMIVHSLPTTGHASPFWLTKVPVSAKKRCTRKKFRCGYQAIEALRTMKLGDDYYGADVCDDNGVKLAEVDVVQ